MTWLIALSEYRCLVTLTPFTLALPHTQNLNRVSAATESSVDETH
jgi:hypothetical protein